MARCVAASIIMGMVVIAVGCSGGGGGGNTRNAPTATAAPPSIEAIRAYIGQGFINEKISYKSTLITSFRDPLQVIALADACDGNDAGATQHGDPNFWPTILGKCFTAGDATMRLYQYTGRDDFLLANSELERLHRTKLDEANADGAGIGEDYWNGVVASVYSQPAFTPTPAATEMPSGG